MVRKHTYLYLKCIIVRGAVSVQEYKARLPLPTLTYYNFHHSLLLLSVYREDLYLPLIQSIKLQSHRNTLCFIGCTRQFTKPLFFQMLEVHGLAYKKLPSGVLADGQLDESIGLFVIHKVE